jgi:transcription antitermination factor NusG
MSKAQNKSTATTKTDKLAADTGPAIEDVPGTGDSILPVISPPMLMTDAELKMALTALREEQRRRDEAKESLRPKVGAKVRITKGRPKFVGKVGTVIIARKTRCFVAVPEIAAAAYVHVSDIEQVDE